MSQLIFMFDVLTLLFSRNKKNFLVEDEFG